MLICCICLFVAVLHPEHHIASIPGVQAYLMQPLETEPTDSPVQHGFLGSHNISQCVQALLLSMHVSKRIGISAVEACGGVFMLNVLDDLRHSVLIKIGYQVVQP